MTRDYGEMVNLALELGQYGGYLDTQGRTERIALQGKYDDARRRFAYGLLKQDGSVENAVAAVRTDLQEIRALSDDYWSPVYDEVEADLIAQIEKDGSKKSWQRTARHFAPLIVAIVVATLYFGTRLYAATPVNAQVETRQGLVQRAYALEKVLRYDDWAETRGGRYGWIKPILLWPIEPTEAELKGAKELAGLVMGGADQLQSAGQVCNREAPNQADNLSASEIALLHRVDTTLIAQPTHWRDPPIMTLLDPIRKAYPC